MTTDERATLDRIKHVARAICKSRTCEGFNCCQWPAQAGRRHNCPVERGGYDDAASDAILALTALQSDGRRPEFRCGFCTENVEIEWKFCAHCGNGPDWVPVITEQDTKP